MRFSLEFRSKFENAFQDFFTSIMEHRHPGDFQKVKPYGNEGDHKCDGYHESLQRVFQVYAPEAMNVSRTNAKIEQDFQGAIEHWAPALREWVFMHNQWRGVPAQVLEKLLSVNGRKGVKALRWCEPELRAEFFLLPPETQSLILGPAPTPQTLLRIEVKDLIPVVNAIAQLDAPPPEEVKAVPAGKIEANALSDNVRALLTIGSRKAKLVQNFFAQWHDPELGDRVARAFRSRYDGLRSQGITGDDAFLDLWKFAGAASMSTVAHEAAVLAVLAFLFDECDIFEAPRTKEQ
jgi:hypothetical protein